VVLPETAHAAFYKACEYFDLTPVRVPVEPESLAADPRAIADAISENTILLVASAPSYAHGVVDPVAEIAELAARHRLHLHVDACVGGMYLPFLRELGQPVPEFDFSIPGVTQLSMDFHKWGYAAKGASAILYRDATMRRHQIFAWSGWTGYTVVNPTILSTRSGGPLAACWAILEHLGREGYLELVERSQRAALAIREAIERHPALRLLGRPVGNLFAFTSDDRDVFAIADAMRARGWYIQPQFGFGPSPANIHLSVGASNAPHAREFIADLVACADAAPAKPAAGDLGLPADLGALSFDGLAGWLGLTGTDLPAGMAPINRILDRLPHPSRDGLLAEYVNRLYRAR
jgi:glutamate/tyrosine decarboxylase-like PLP-dependent enzyme